ncbi:MAG: F0F1 ATP synthase subunit epsilon [Legionellales bacterium]|nr:F0F1 ATP synthase subunit epsilon [Legionellales bacterium]|tara:strand:+ start:756 stop:1181 length:426 start_codon:yes stop_codon:yes gene_type:complete
MTFYVDVDIVSAEAHIFSGKAQMLFASGELGEMGVSFGHAQLLTSLKPGYVRLRKQDGNDEIFYISGGFLEVQPEHITVLADVAERAADLDEAAALEAKKQAQKLLEGKQAQLDYAVALMELARASAQLRAIQALKRKTVF